MCLPETEAVALHHDPAGTYVLNRNIKVKDRAVTVRGDGIGVTRLVWGANARSVGLGIVQVPFCNVDTCILMQVALGAAALPA